MARSREEIDQVLKLDAASRYQHTVKRVVDFGKAYGLANKDGLVMASDNPDQRQELIPLWPHAEYAMLCATNAWGDCEPRALELEYLRENLLPQLECDGVGVAVFMTPGDRGVVVSARRLLEDLNKELSEWY